jgi:hypothetical protein
MKQNDSLCHYGIFGMHWGVRRFQNKDGSLTPEGRKHYYGSEMTRNEKLKMTRARNAELKAKKDKLIAKGDKQALYKNRELFTDEEYDEAMKRADKFEQTKNDLSVTKMRERAIANAEKAEKAAVRSAAEKQKEDEFKESLLRSGNPKLILKNAALFSDEELGRAYQRLQRISSIDSLTDSDRLKSVNAQQTVRNNKPAIDQMIEGAGKMNKLVDNTTDLIIDSYQSYNKTASIINAISDSNKKLPVFALEPWDSLKPKNKKINKNDFDKVLEDYGLLDSLSNEQKKELYNKIVGG